MPNIELMSDRIARISLEKRRNRETERQERIFNQKMRTIGVDKEALDIQVREKKRLEETEKKKQNAYEADVIHGSKVARILQNRERKERRAIEEAIETYRHQHQQPCKQREFDLNDPDRFRKLDQHDAQMMLPGLVGEDLESRRRQQRQREQLRGWLTQQQTEQAAQRRQQKLEKQNYDQSRIEVENKAVELHSLEMEKRKEEAMAAKNYNLSQAEEKRRQDEECKKYSFDARCSGDMVGVPGLSPSSDLRAPPESLQQVIQFQKKQVETKQRMELEKKQEEEHYDRIRLDSARRALLRERMQARLTEQLRRDVDNVNVQLAQMHKREKPDIERGQIDDSFFSKFNTCSR
ncbi:RIB43A-like with coiled-coils protein 2 [Melanotaenia boesemani]|uniref:RIB43A-like with coiled-coils protein 2 n=1 Tax=Melanotaenia boesemani TaxID=1250792 RepID=UPI001C05CE6A|nr:RIB43A-like with coiled-coils protein 2 [Melanotaenia boesemani]